MRLFETHAHLSDERFDGEIPSILSRASQAGVAYLTVASADGAESRSSIDIVRQYSSATLPLYCMVGYHPHVASSFGEEDEAFLRDVLSRRKDLRICALGEIGLDYFFDNSPREIQREVFRKQLDIAFTYDVPIVLHERDAAQDSLTILREYYASGRLRGVPGVCHCFSGSVETGRELVRMGFYLGFDGPITFKNNKRAPEVLLSVPKERLLIETDCPYLTPEPHRGQRNEPAYVRNVLEKMAAILSLDPEVLAEVTTENGKRLFGIEESSSEFFA